MVPTVCGAWADKPQIKKRKIKKIFILTPIKKVLSKQKFLLIPAFGF